MASSRIVCVRQRFCCCWCWCCCSGCLCCWFNKLPLWLCTPKFRFLSALNRSIAGCSSSSLRPLHGCCCCCSPLDDERQLIPRSRIDARLLLLPFAVVAEVVAILESRKCLGLGQRREDRELETAPRRSCCCCLSEIVAAAV